MPFALLVNKLLEQIGTQGSGNKDTKIIISMISANSPQMLTISYISHPIIVYATGKSIICFKNVHLINYGSTFMFAFDFVGMFDYCRLCYPNIKKLRIYRNVNVYASVPIRLFPPKTLKYWVGVQRGQSFLMGTRCLFSLGWPPF